MGLFNDLFRKKGISEKIDIFHGYEINEEAIYFAQQGFDKYQAKDYAGAVASFTKAINLQPANPNLITMRGTAFEDLGNDLEAENDFRRATDIRPTDYVAAYRLGMVFFRKKI